MHENIGRVNSIAALQNVGIITLAIKKTISRPDYLPGLVVVYGPSGYGKTVASSYAAANLKAYYVSAKAIWTRKIMLQSILAEMGIPAGKTVAQMFEQVCEHLSCSGKILIIDEYDYCVDCKGLMALTRDIYDTSEAPIVLIGEEKLPSKLSKEERFHNRILDWIPALPASFDDAVKLRELYCDKVNIADDLLEKVWKISEGRVRRIVVNLNKIQDTVLADGKSSVNLISWGKRELVKGEAPVIRRL